MEAPLAGATSAVFSGSSRKIAPRTHQRSECERNSRDPTTVSRFSNLSAQQTRARKKRPLSFKRTWPLAKRSATVATVSLLLLVQELTAKMRSPSESLVRGFRIWRFLFISWPFWSIATLMPSVIVNISSMPRGAVIHFLCTFTLTIELHFCSIFEHKSWMGWRTPLARSTIRQSDPEAF